VRADTAERAAKLTEVLSANKDLCIRENIAKDSKIVDLQE